MSAADKTKLDSLNASSKDAYLYYYGLLKSDTTYTYNTDGTVATTSMASTDGTETCTTTYTYDSNGNVTKTVSTIKVGSNSYTKTVTFTYDSSNNVTKHSVTYS